MCYKGTSKKPTKKQRVLEMNIVTFGTKHRDLESVAKSLKLDLEDVIAIDCRDMPNPYRVPHLKNLNGKSPEVQGYVFPGAKKTNFIAQAEAVASSDETFIFFCVGGHHRSVSAAEILAAHYRNRGVKVRVKHFEI